MIEKTLFLLAGIFGALCLLTQPASADRQSLASIILQAEDFLIRHPYQSPYPVDFELSRLDSRLHLKNCAKPLDIGFTNPAKTVGNTSLTVRCPLPVEWLIHLPISVRVFNDVIVNRTPLIKGQYIDESDLEHQKLDISRLNQGFFRDKSSLLELQAKRNLPAGTVLNPANLAAKKLVKSGERVTLILNIDGLSVTSEGVALQSARRGQVIKVKNPQSNRIIEGVVSGAGRVRVNM